MTPESRWPGLRLAALAVVLGGAILASLLVGAAAVSPAELVRALAGPGDPTARTILLELRLPRTALAALVGGGLALSGAVFQSLLRNPLADPYVLGVSGGAAVGAVAALVLGGAVGAAGLPLAAFAGAVGAIALVVRIAARAHAGLDTRVLLLAGVVVGAFFNAVVLLLLTFADAETFRSAIFWIMGSLAGASWPAAAALAAYLVPAAAVLLVLARPLNVMTLGEETAFHLGTRVEVVKRVAYAVTSLAVAACVAVSGVVGFVGLLVPHAVRLAWGSDHRHLLPGSLLGGAAFLLLADTAARVAAAPAELPVGVVTALVGVPLFVVLLRRSER